MAIWFKDELSQNWEVQYINNYTAKSITYCTNNN
jgi:hypothetical protein